jgi:hypothetical protein
MTVFIAMRLLEFACSIYVAAAPKATRRDWDRFRPPSISKKATRAAMSPIDHTADVGRDWLFGKILLCFRPRRGGLAANAN